MTRYTPQWLQAGSYAASVDRRLMQALWPTPACSGCAVTVASGMTVNVAGGQVAVPTQNNTGTTLCTSDAVEQVTLAAAPGSGTNRYDLITCQPRGNDLDGGANNDFIFTSVTGVAAATPGIPATPAGSVALARIYVPGGSASITAGNVADVRPFGLSIGGTGALPPPITTGSTIQTFQDQNGDWWVAKNGVNGGAWKRARDVLHARMYRAAAWTASLIPMPMDATTRDPYGLYVSANTGFLIPLSGLWRAYYVCNMTSTGASQYCQPQILVNGTIVATVNVYAAGASNYISSLVSVSQACQANDVITLGAKSGAALTGGVGSNACWTELDYIGTG